MLLIYSCKGDLPSNRMDSVPGPTLEEEQMFIQDNEILLDTISAFQAEFDAKTEIQKNAKKAFVISNKKKINSIDSTIEKAKQISELTALNNEVSEMKMINNNIRVNALNIHEKYEPGKNHTLSLQLEVDKNLEKNLSIQVKLPSRWQLISSAAIQRLTKGDKNLSLINLYIPKNATPGKTILDINIIDEYENIVTTKKINIIVAKNYDLEVFTTSSPNNVKAGEKIVSIYGVRNLGNVTQKLSIFANGEIEGKTLRTIAPDSLLTIRVKKETEAGIYRLMNLSTYVEVKSEFTEEKFRAYSSTTVFPSKIEKEDPFFRFPISLSLYYNSRTYRDNHFSTLSAEMRGNGYLDLEKNHHLNFIVRAPQQQNLKRFGVTDQYSLVYNYRDRTTVYLGDHAYFINRLGFESRYGMGFRIDQKYKDWLFTAHYTKPRLYSFNSEPLYGLKAVYRVSDSLYIGGSISSSKGTFRGASREIEANPDEKGQIATINLDFQNRGTTVEAEVSGSLTNKATDFAGYLNLVQSIGTFTYSGMFTISGENYFGALSNSLQYSNNLFYRVNKWNFATGQTVSRVNRRLDPLFFAAEPYYENLYGLIGYRFNKKHYVNVRGDIREREDQLEPKLYHYKERGLLYRYLYSGDKLQFNFSGRIAETNNLLAGNNIYRSSYSHNIGGSYRILENLILRTGLSHNYNNRYGTSGNSSNYTRYLFGFNYNVNRKLRINATYNSGFSPDESYKKRDFVNSNIMFRLNKNHQFELRTNYFENAGVLNRKELLALGKYTYSFGVPLKRIIQQGGIEGIFYSDNPNISVENINVMAAGTKIATDASGKFEINNLLIGKNHILIDENSLPDGIVLNKKAITEVEIQQGKKKFLTFELMQGGNVTGSVQLLRNIDTLGFKTYLKLSNEEFSYYVESDINGQFAFQNVVPGSYNLDLVGLKEDEYEKFKNRRLYITEGETADVFLPLVEKKREIRFSKKNFTLGK